MLLLLKHEADPNWKDCQGWSLLHQAACSGDITFIKTCVRNGKGDTRSLNQDNQYPVDLAALRGHTPVMEYLDAHSGDLKSVCRGVIRKALGVRIHHLNKLPLPPRVKLFLNFNIPYLGFSAVLVPPEPWTPEQLHRREVGAQELHTFIEETASEEFLEEHEDVLFGKESERLVELFQEMYLWESFKKVEFEEPLPRKPRYSLVKLEKSKNKKFANFFLTHLFIFGVNHNDYIIYSHGKTIHCA